MKRLVFERGVSISRTINHFAHPRISTSLSFLGEPRNLGLDGCKSRKGAWYNIEQMIRERKVWLVARELEKKGKLPITFEILSEETKRKYPHTFKEDSDVYRAIQATVPEYAEWQNGINTKGKGDDHFFWPIFWNRVLTEVGFWRVEATILSILGLAMAALPHGIISQIISKF